MNTLAPHCETLYTGRNGLVDNVYGDKNVFCNCVPINAFAGEIEAFSEPNVA